MRKKCNLCFINTSKKGFTLTELMVSILFVVVIIGTASYAWYSGNEAFKSTNKVSVAYTQARTLETMIQTASSTTPSLKFTDSPLNNNGSIKYSHFYFDYTGTSPIYKVSFYGDNSVLIPATIEFQALDNVSFSVKSLGRRCILKYRIESTDEDDPFYIEGGVVLNNIDENQFSEDNPGAGSLPAVLNFQAPEI